MSGKIVNTKRIAVNTIFLYMKTLITMAISFVATRIVLDSLGATDFGIYGTVGGAIVMLEALNGAMAQATQRFMNYAEGQGDKEKLICLFNNTVLLHICLGIIILLLMAALYYPLFNGIFNIPEDRVDAAKYIYLFLAISTFFTIITIPYDAMINAHENFMYYSIVGIVVALLKLAVAFMIVNYMSDRLIFYGLMMAAITIVNMLIMRVYCKVKYQECVFLPQKYADITMAKEIGTFAGWNFIGAFAGIAGNHGSTILMNHFFGPILIAAKNIGDQICTQVALLTYNMTKALNPAIVKSEGSGDHQTMINLSYNSCRFSFLLYMLLAIPFIFNTESLLVIWLKKVPEWAVLFCQLQVVRTLFEQLFSPLRISLMAQGSIRQINVIDLFLSIATFLSLWLLYDIGFLAYWHYYVSIIFLVVLSGLAKVYFCRNKCQMKVRDYIQMVVSPCIVVMIISCIATFLLQRMMGELNDLIVVSIEVFSLFLIESMVGLTKQERSIMLSKIASRMKWNRHE